MHCFCLHLFAQNIFNDPEIQEQPIYSGASINRGQLLCLILAFILKHSISGSGLKDLLDLLNIVAPECAPTSKYYFDKSFFNLAKQFEIHHYCKICSQYIGKLFTPCCSDGNVDERVNKNEGYYFLVMPLRQQLKELFQNTTFYKFLNDNKTNMGMGDIYSGSMYTSKLKTFVDTLDNISLSFNLMGLQFLNHPITQFGQLSAQSMNFHLLSVESMLSYIPFGLVLNPKCQHC